ncbi:MAG: hypothetical protein ACYS1A_13985 [Planctomycetota bacterium]|jgi:hypothetical protein
MKGEFSVFWSILLPLVMLAGSVFLTYALYKHFAGKMDKQQEEAKGN